MNDCIFCKIVAGQAKSWKVYENEQVYAFLDIHPVSEYHTLVIPKNHFENIFDVPESELREIITGVKTVVNLLNRKVGINNVQIINSSGREAQQDVFHIHFHIVPRKHDDGQDVVWTVHQDWVEKYDHLLEKIAD
jgi:histidine triad (HIT) family protein